MLLPNSCSGLRSTLLPAAEDVGATVAAVDEAAVTCEDAAAGASAGVCEMAVSCNLGPERGACSCEEELRCFALNGG